MKILTFEAAQKSYDDIKWPFIEHITDRGNNQFSFVVFRGHVSEEDTVSELAVDQSLEDILGPGKPIGINAKSTRYFVKFEKYVAISITNESYANHLETASPLSGRRLRVYEKSHFLDFISQTTFASDVLFPRIFKHYRFSSLNHIIDVASCDPPTIFCQNE